MLGNLIFAIRMLVVTVVIIMLMQIRIGQSTLEDRAYVMLHSSTVTSYLQRVAVGAVRLYNETTRKITSALDGRADSRQSTKSP